MALIVAIAVGLFITRSLGDLREVRRSILVSFMIDDRSSSSRAYRSKTYGSDCTDRATAVALRPRNKGEVIYWARRLSFWPAPCMAALSLATLGLGLGHARRLAGRPGIVMAVAVTLAMGAAAVRLPHLLGPNLSAWQFNWMVWRVEFWFTAPRLAGFAVAVSWVALALGGRWRAGGGWLDCLGVSLGAAWIGTALIDLGMTWYEALPFEATPGQMGCRQRLLDLRRGAMLLDLRCPTHTFIGPARRPPGKCEYSLIAYIGLVTQAMPLAGPPSQGRDEP